MPFMGSASKSKKRSSGKASLPVSNDDNADMSGYVLPKEDRTSQTFQLVIAFS